MSAKARRRFVFLFLLAAAAIAGVVYLGFSRPWDQHRQIADEVPISARIRVGYLPIYVDLPLFVAAQRQYFTDRGLVVELVRFEQSPDMGSALATGRIDAAASIATSVYLANEARDPGLARIFLVDAENPEGYLSSLVISQTSPVTSAQQLSGKAIGFFPGPSARVFGQRALEALGLPRQSYRMVEMPVGNHIAALESGTVDALVTYEPTSTQAVLQNNARKLVPGLVETHVITPWQAGVWIIAERLLRTRPQASALFIQSIYSGVQEIRRDPAASKEALTAYTPINVAVARATPNIPFTMIGEVDVGALQRHANILQEESVISKRIEVEPLLIPQASLRAPPSGR